MLRITEYKLKCRNLQSAYCDVAAESGIIKLEKTAILGNGLLKPSHGNKYKQQ
jgi:hypothetical protein